MKNGKSSRVTIGALTADRLATLERVHRTSRTSILDTLVAKAFEAAKNRGLLAEYYHGMQETLPDGQEAENE